MSGDQPPIWFSDTDERPFFVHPHWRGGVPLLLVLNSEFYFELTVPQAQMAEALEPFVWIRVDGFRLEASIQRGLLVVRRNDDMAFIAVNQLPTDRSEIGIRFGWSPTRLVVGVTDGQRTEHTRITTKATIPPPRLVREAERANLLTTQTYATEEALRERVIAGIHSIKKKLLESDGYTAFWNSVDGEDGLQRAPKREVEAQSTIHALLHDFAITAGIEVVPELKSGAGRLDFAFFGYVCGVGIRPICAELKNAHSDAIEVGLRNQLPTYMQAKGATYGIYVVLCYHGKWFDPPESAKPPLLFRRLDAVKDEMTRETARNISLLYLDVAKPPTASM